MIGTCTLSSRHRTKHEDRDLYDFKLKCGNRWTSWSGLWFKSEVEDKEWECPSKMYVTGTAARQSGQYRSRPCGSSVPRRPSRFAQGRDLSRRGAPAPLGCRSGATALSPVPASPHRLGMGEAFGLPRHWLGGARHRSVLS